MPDLTSLERQLASERQARLDAEELAERKSAELDALRSEALSFHRELELRVAERTAQLHDSLEIARSYAAKARAASLAKSSFLANMSHELRTPLHAILSFSRFGREGSVSAAESDREYFEIIERSATDLLGLVDGLLDLARLEAGHDLPVLAPVELGDLVSTTLEELGGLASGRMISITSRIDDLGGPVPLDARKIRRVLRNIVANALRYSAEGAGEVEVVVERSDEMARVSVRDHGVGIPAAERETIFEKFVQSTRTRDGSGGTGLGLAICREIVVRHGGEIWVEEAPSGGSVFRFTIPLGRRDGAGVPARSSSDAGGPAGLDLEGMGEKPVAAIVSSRSCRLDRDLVAMATADLEALSPTTTRLAELIGGDDGSLEEIERIVSLDPVLTGRLLSYANSASSGSRTVATVRRAVMQLGLGQLLAFAAAGSVRRQLEVALPQYGLSEGGLWRHLVASALAVELLPGVLKRPVPPESFAAALLHDVGKLVIARFLDAEGVRRIGELRESRNASLSEAELEVLGIEHGEVGALVARQWHLPEGIVRGIARYGHPEIGETVADVVHVANIAAKSIGEPATADPGELVPHPAVAARLALSEESFGRLVERLADRLDETLARYQ